MKEVARCLVGSQNYQLAGPESDRDYKILLCPTFNDLYNFHRVGKGDLVNFDHDHYSPMDIRQFNDLLLKCNPNVLEMVFSTEWEYTDTRMETYLLCARRLLKQGYLALHWTDFYSATMGLVLNSLKRYGETNPKSVSRACYFFNLVNHVAANDFVMDNSVWRNQLYNDYCYNIRFNSEVYDLQVITNSVKNQFESQKYLLSEQAERWCREHNSDNDYLVDTLFLKAENLSTLMRDIVKLKIAEELYTNDFI